LPTLSSLPSLFDARARCELGFTAPFALLAGGLYGYQLDRGVVFVAACALALTGFVALQLGLEPAVVSRFGGTRGQWGSAVAFVWDGVTGAVMGLPVLWVVGLPAGPAVGAAASFGAFYGWLMGFVVCGDAPEAVVRMLFEGGGRLRTSDHSYAQSLEARGESEAAANQYRQAIVGTPLDPAPYLALARLQQRDLRRPADAIITLRSALAEARLEPRQEMLILRRMVDVFAGMGRPFGGAPDLARYLEHKPDGFAAAWAADTLADMKEHMARERDALRHGPPPQPGV
jgi:hypothetical protein